VGGHVRKCEIIIPKKKLVEKKMPDKRGTQKGGLVFAKSRKKGGRGVRTTKR